MIDADDGGARVIDTKTTERRRGKIQRGTSCFGDLLRTATSARFIEKRSSLLEKKRFSKELITSFLRVLCRKEEIERDDRTNGLIIYIYIFLILFRRFSKRVLCKRNIPCD